MSAVNRFVDCSSKFILIISAWQSSFSLSSTYSPMNPCIDSSGTQISRGIKAGDRKSRQFWEWNSVSCICGIIRVNGKLMMLAKLENWRIMFVIGWWREGMRLWGKIWRSKIRKKRRKGRKSSRVMIWPRFPLWFKFLRSHSSKKISQSTSTSNTNLFGESTGW